MRIKPNHGDTEAVNKPSMTNFHKFSGDPKCIATSQRSFIGHLNDKFFVAKPSYSFDSGFIHSFTETRRKSCLIYKLQKIATSGVRNSADCAGTSTASAAKLHSSRGYSGSSVGVVRKPKSVSRARAR